MPLLCVNVDHVATLRQARLGQEPDPVLGAHEAELGGASGIIVHLREDRRHIQDRDVEVLRRTVNTRLNLEMAATREMQQIALTLGPDTVCLVPEKRQELTTEGGLTETLGVVRTATKPDNTDAEFAIVIRSDQKGSGLGSILFRKMIDYTRARGTRHISGQTLVENKAMQGLARKFGFEIKLNPDEELVDMVLDLSKPGPSA